MIGDVVKILHKQWTVKGGQIKGYKAFPDQATGKLARDPRGHLLGMITPRDFLPGTIGVVATEIEKVAPQGIDAIGVTIRFGEDDPGEIWWFPLENVQMR